MQEMGTQTPVPIEKDKKPCTPTFYCIWFNIATQRGALFDPWIIAGWGFLILVTGLDQLGLVEWLEAWIRLEEARIRVFISPHLARVHTPNTTYTWWDFNFGHGIGVVRSYKEWCGVKDQYSQWRWQSNIHETSILAPKKVTRLAVTQERGKKIVEGHSHDWMAEILRRNENMMSYSCNFDVWNKQQ